MGKQSVQKKADELKIAVNEQRYFETTSKASFGLEALSQQTKPSQVSTSKRNQSQVVLGDEQEDMGEAAPTAPSLPSPKTRGESKTIRDKLERSQFKLGGDNFDSDSRFSKKTFATLEGKSELEWANQPPTLKHQPSSQFNIVTGQSVSSNIQNGRANIKGFFTRQSAEEDSKGNAIVVKPR